MVLFHIHTSTFDRQQKKTNEKKKQFEKYDQLLFVLKWIFICFILFDINFTTSMWSRCEDIGTFLGMFEEDEKIYTLDCI